MSARFWILFVACQLAGFSASYASVQFWYTPVGGLTGVAVSFVISVLLLAPGDLLVMPLLVGRFSLVRFWLVIATCVLLNAGAWWIVAWRWRVHKARNPQNLQGQTGIS